MSLYICKQDKRQTSMQSTLLQLAQEIVRGGPRGPEANQQFRNIISEVGNLNDSLAALGESDIYCFVYCSNMIKLIESGQFSIVSETKSEENVLNLNDNTTNVKLKVYGQIVATLVELILGPNKPSHIRKSQIDLAALCLKTLFEDSCHFSFLQKTILAFLPHYLLPEAFNTTTETSLQIIVPRYPIDVSTLSQYATLLEILISMFQYVTVQTANKTYYQYRRSIYIFRNSYLAFFLYLAVQHTKLLFQHFDHSAPMSTLMNLTIQLLEAVFMYPFTLSLHEFEVDEDSADNLTGSGSGEIYFPNYFRHAICDTSLLQQIYSFFQLTTRNSQPFEQKRNIINSLVKILGRAICASQYTFKNDDEKQVCREFGVSLLQNLSSSYQCGQSYYLNTIMDIHYKMLTMYDFYFSSQRNTIVNTTLGFLYHALHNYPIKIQEGKKSPLARTFQLLAIVIEYSKDKGEEQEAQVRIKSQKILEKVYERILGEGEVIMGQFGFNQPTEIECMTELFENVGPAFEFNLLDNLAFFNQVNIFSLSSGSATLWLHLCAQLLPKTTANLDQTSIILKYYQLAKDGDSLARLRYIRAMAQEVMGEFFQGQPHTSLWNHMVEMSGVNFKAFVSCILQVCTRNFETTNNQILDYSLQLFKIIYVTLKKNDHKTFEEFYQLVNSLLQNMQDTVFSKPTHYHKRRDFFHVISLIWINSDTVSYIYEIHALITTKLDSGTPESFFQYLHDITGLIEPLDIHQAFQVLTELALDDLTKLFTIHFCDTDKIRLYFSDQMFMKIFCKLIYALISDINRKLFFQTHTKIPLRIFNLIAPVMMVLVEGGYEYPNRFINILEKMTTLHPLGQLVPFSNIARILKEQSSEDFDKLVRAYFDHIHRVADISWMHELIENSADHMVSWWEEAMVRNMHPNVNFRTIVESRFWTTTRQKETFAKLLFELAYYDNHYWQVDPSLGERAFVEQFSKIYI